MIPTPSSLIKVWDQETENYLSSIEVSTESVMWILEEANCLKGTYTRTTAINMLVNAFLQGTGVKQIVSLGAGTDTRPYRIFSRGDHPPLIYHEVDFEVVTRKKERTTRGSPVLSKIVPDITMSEDGVTWSSKPTKDSEYHCHGIDLRKLADAWETSPLPGLRADVPTLLLSECCLCYLAPEQAKSLLRHFSTTIGDLGAIIYEPIRPNDPFGKIMTSNLARRGIQMPTLEVYPELRDQEQRLKDLGLGTSKALTVEDIWKKWIKAEEKERVDGLEGLDEVEEWELLAAHYVVSWGFRGKGFEGWSNIS